MMQSKGILQKTNWRLQWSQTKYKEIRAKKTKNEAWRVIDAHQGHYRSYNYIVREEGGGPEDRLAAQRYVDKCISMGAHWMRYNGMSERYDYLCSFRKKRRVLARVGTSNRGVRHDRTPCSPQQRCQRCHTTEDVATDGQAWRPAGAREDC